MKSFHGIFPVLTSSPCVAVQVFIRNEGDARAEVSAAPDEGAEGSEGVVRPVLTTEFDVFECNSFVEEPGKWLRLMPDAGFVPT